MNIRSNNPVKNIFHLLEDRHYRQIVSDAYSLLIANTASWFKTVWPFCLLYGVLSTVMLFVVRIPSLTLFLCSCCVYLLFVVFLLALMSNVAYRVLQNSDNSEVLVPVKFKSTMATLFPSSVNTFILMLIGVVVAVIILYVASILQTYTSAVWVVACLLIAFLAVPFNLSSFLQVVSGKTFIGALTFGFKNAFRHFGSTIFLLFFSTTIIILLGVIFCMPLEILNISINLSDEALMHGDPTDIPTYVFAEYYILGVVMLTLFSYFALIFIVPLLLHAVALNYRSDKK